MSGLTPYDTGAMLEPRLYVTGTAGRDTVILTSDDNRVLNDLRRTSVWESFDSGEYYLMDMAERIAYQWDYLTESFGRAALNDGLYSPDELEHATKVLRLLVVIYDIDTKEDEQ